MTATLKSPNRAQFLWPAIGVTLGALVAINPFYQPRIALNEGVAVWFLAMAVAVLLSVHPIAARFGSIAIGMSLAVPCFLYEEPLLRGLLMCGMAFPLVVIAVPLLAPPNATYRERMAYLFTWLGTREVKRRPWRFNVNSLIHLVAATIVLCAGAAAVKATPVTGAWLPLRWLAGGTMIFAFAEVVTAGHDFVTALMGLSAPALMRSPAFSTSLSEFWRERWNPATALLLFRTFFFTPFARRGAGIALCVTFFASAVAHVLLPYMAMGKLGIALTCGAFFLVQPFLLAAERALKVRHWPTPTARVWTLSALAIASPLFVEPVLQLLETGWGPTDTLIRPTLAVVGCVIGFTVLYALGALVTISDPAMAHACPADSAARRE